MKKLGRAGRARSAAAGSAWEKVGLAAVGTPSPWRIGEASGLPSALSCLDCSSSPVALRSALPTVFWACWPPAEAEGPLSLAPGTESAGVVDVLVDGAAGAVVVDAGAAGSGEVEVEVSVVSVGAGAGVGEELVPVSTGGGAGVSAVTDAAGVET